MQNVNRLTRNARSHYMQVKEDAVGVHDLLEGIHTVSLRCEPRYRRNSTEFWLRADLACIDAASNRFLYLYKKHRKRGWHHTQATTLGRWLLEDEQANAQPGMHEAPMAL
jgi:hypothetical protein